MRKKDLPQQSVTKLKKPTLEADPKTLLHEVTLNNLNSHISDNTGNNCYRGNKWSHLMYLKSGTFVVVYQ